MKEKIDRITEIAKICSNIERRKRELSNEIALLSKELKKKKEELENIVSDYRKSQQGFKELTEIINEYKSQGFEIIEVPVKIERIRLGYWYDPGGLEEDWEEGYFDLREITKGYILKGEDPNKILFIYEGKIHALNWPISEEIVVDSWLGYRKGTNAFLVDYPKQEDENSERILSLQFWDDMGYIQEVWNKLKPEEKESFSEGERYVVSRKIFAETKEGDRIVEVDKNGKIYKHKIFSIDLPMHPNYIPFLDF